MNHNRAHLIPTAVTNKNGVRTTVYRKPDVGTISSAKLPQASLPTHQKTRRQLERQTAEALVDLDFGPPTTEVDATNRAKNYQQLLAVLPDYSDESLQRFIETANTDLGWELNNMLCDSQRGEDYLNDWLTVKSIPLDNTANIEHILNGLVTYKLLTPQNKGNYPPQRTAALTAIVRVSAHLGTTGEGLAFGVTHQQEIMVHIEDQKLRDLLSTHEDPAAVADLIISRNLTDADQITALYETMTSTVQAISDGSL